MPTRTNVMLPTRLAGTLGLLLWLVPACTPLEPPPVVQSLPRPGVRAVAYAHPVNFAAGTTDIGATEAGALRVFIASLPRDGRLTAQIVGYADSRAAVDDIALVARRAAVVAGMLRAAGVREVEIAPVRRGEARPADPRLDAAAWSRARRVDITVDGTEIVLPGCPDWSRDPGFDPGNLPLSNLGCANAYNLGLMVADPGDLAPSRALAPADGTREAEAIVRYRTDKVRPLQADIIQ